MTMESGLSVLPATDVSMASSQRIFISSPISYFWSKGKT